ncbi:phage major capsid protein [Actinomadura fulvescens]|uniref:Phage major capsid protein n=1 Tax=Actinomadura fulvescens TaxID=46160 RepID=A0ABN3Q6P4_9ACTN
MPYNDMISRDASNDPLVPESVSAEVIKEMPKSSAVLQLARRAAMSTKSNRQPVLSVLPTAYWVNGDSGMKQTTREDWTNVTLVAEELAAIVPVPEAYVDDAQVPVWDEVRPSLAEALGRALDLAAIFGMNKPATWPSDIYTGAVAAGNTQAPGSDLGQSVAHLARTITKDGFGVNGFATAPGFGWELMGFRNAQGNPIYQPDPTGEFAGRLYNRPASEVDNGGWDATKASLIAGDWSKAVIGVRQDITFKVFTEGVISDDTGKVILNLMQQDSIALRVVARFGFAVANPATALNPNAATRWPFGILSPVPALT